MKEQISEPGSGKLVQQLVELLQNGHAHVTFNDAVKDIPFESLGEKPHGLAYSIWQIAEHIRIAQWDILDFSRNENYKEMKWPDDYWPHENAPENGAAWKTCLEEIKNDQDEFISLLHAQAGDLFKPFPHGSGQTLLREALLIADDHSDDVGQLIVLRRLLGNWS